MIRRAFAFAIVFGTLQIGWQLLDGSALQHLLIDRGVVVPAAWIARILTPTLGVYALGDRLRVPTGGINIVNGCDGMETLFLLVAGFVVAPLPRRARLSGIFAGVPVVYVLNLVRILTLFYAHRDDARLFDLLHGVVTPIAMVLAIVAFYYVWLLASNRHAVESSC